MSPEIDIRRDLVEFIERNGGGVLLLASKQKR